jgi:membrane-associated phospholipid phosphatase
VTTGGTDLTAGQLGERPGEGRAEAAAERIRLFHARHVVLRAGVALVLAGVALSVVTAITMPNPVQQPIDDRWLSWMVDIRWGPLTAVAKAMSFIGGPTVTLPLRIGICVWLLSRRQWLRLSSFIAAVVTSELCIGPIKAIVERPRPPDGMVATSGWSFPSGHATAAAVTAMGLVIVLTGPGRRRIHWFVAATIFAATMALSRTYLGVHWLSDVIAGACFGIGWALVWPTSLETSRDAFYTWRDGRLRDAALGPPHPVGTSGSDGGSPAPAAGSGRAADHDPG